MPEYTVILSYREPELPGPTMYVANVTGDNPKAAVKEVLLMRDEEDTDPMYEFSDVVVIAGRNNDIGPGWTFFDSPHL